MSGADLKVREEARQVVEMDPLPVVVTRVAGSERLRHQCLRFSRQALDEFAHSPDRRRSDHQSLTDPALRVARFRHVIGVDESVLVTST